MNFHYVVVGKDDNGNTFVFGMWSSLREAHEWAKDSGLSDWKAVRLYEKECPYVGNKLETVGAVQ